jgi:hypothetical protein
MPPFLHGNPVKVKEHVLCQYCANQGLRIEAKRLRGDEGIARNEYTVRYGCSNGHKFGVPISEAQLKE